MHRIKTVVAKNKYKVKQVKIKRKTKKCGIFIKTQNLNVKMYKFLVLCPTYIRVVINIFIYMKSGISFVAGKTIIHKK